MDPIALSQTETIVRRVLDQWKPYAWGSRSARSIDLATQAHAVAGKLDHVDTPDDVATLVAATLSAYYPECEERFTRYTCTSVGTRLYRELHAARMLPSQLT